MGNDSRPVPGPSRFSTARNEALLPSAIADRMRRSAASTYWKGHNALVLKKSAIQPINPVPGANAVERKEVGIPVDEERLGPRCTASVVEVIEGPDREKRARGTGKRKRNAEPFRRRLGKQWPNRPSASISPRVACSARKTSKPAGTLREPDRLSTPPSRWQVCSRLRGRCRGQVPRSSADASKPSRSSSCRRSPQEWCRSVPCRQRWHGTAGLSAGERLTISPLAVTSSKLSTKPRNPRRNGGSCRGRRPRSCRQRSHAWCQERQAGSNPRERNAREYPKEARPHRPSIAQSRDRTGLSGLVGASTEC